VDSSGEEDTAAQKIEAGALVHLALDQLELVDLSLRLSAAPRHGKRRFDRRPILLQSGREGLDGRNTAGLHIFIDFGQLCSWKPDSRFHDFDHLFSSRTAHVQGELSV
jgi:hypothetical protein